MESSGEPAQLIVVERGPGEVADLLLLQQDAPALRFLANDGTGSMDASVAQSFDARVQAAVVGDVHPREGLEILAGTADGHVFLLHEQSRGVLSAPTRVLSFPGGIAKLALVEIDDDGWLDLISISGDPLERFARIHLVPAVGDVAAAPLPQLLALTRSDATVALPADLDGDHDADLVVVDGDEIWGGMRILRNHP